MRVPHGLEEDHTDELEVFCTNGTYVKVNNDVDLRLSIHDAVSYLDRTVLGEATNAEQISIQR